MKLFIIVVTILSLRVAAENLNFFQNEYDVTMDIAKCTWFNDTIYKYFKAEFVLYNRTTRVLNASGEQLIDLGSDLILHIQLYKLMSNEYRFFPVFVSVNVCAEYQKNTFGAKDILSKISNQTPCHLKKGFYYVNNGLPDFSKFPPHLPRGSYKVVSTFKYHSYVLYILELYGKIKDKPVDWKNIPKHIWD